MMKKTVYVLGNSLADIDNTVFRLLPKLQKLCPQFSFVHFDPTEELPPNITNEELIIIDTVIGIKTVKKFNDLNHWTLSPRVTVHDYDLPLSLGMLKKLGKIKNITIIGIPLKGNLNEILKEVKRYLA